MQISTAKIILCAVAIGYFITVYFEEIETALIIPLRNLLLFGTRSSKPNQERLETIYRHGQGINPVHIAQLARTDALSVLERGGIHVHQKTTQKLLETTNLLISLGQIEEISGAKCMMFPYNFDYPRYGIVGTWMSGMAQGHCIELFLAANQVTGDSKYLKAAKLSAETLRIPIDQGGVAVKTANGLWFEEYASRGSTSPYVLNGHNFALNGLWYLSQIEPRYKGLFDAGVIGLKDLLAEFDLGVWSKYDLQGTLCNRKYQRIHANQLYILYKRTKEPIFREYAQRFYTHLWMPFGVVVRLCFRPNRLLVGLFAVNSLLGALVVLLLALISC